MAEKKEYNYGELKAQASKINKFLRVFRGVEDLVAVALDKDNVIRDLEAKQKDLILKTEVGNKELAILNSKIDIAKKDVAARNITIGEKIKRETELNLFIESGWKQKEKAQNAIHEREMEEAKRNHSKAMKDLGEIFNSRLEELKALEDKITTADAKLKQFKENLLSTV